MNAKTVGFIKIFQNIIISLTSKVNMLKGRHYVSMCFKNRRIVSLPVFQGMFS